MKKSQYSEIQSVKILKAVKTGKKFKDACRECGIADATYYNWESKYGGMEVSDVKRLKELEEENRRLNRMYSELSLEHKHRATKRRACRVVGISDSVYRYQPDQQRDELASSLRY